MCPVCVQSPSSLDDNGCDNSNDHETLLKIIDVLQEDIKVLSKNYEDLRKSMAEKENRHLEQIYVSRPTDMQLSNRPELPLGNQEELVGLPNISTLRYEDEWKHIPSKNNKPAYKLNSSTDFPVLRNRFEVLGLNDSCIHSENTRTFSRLSKLYPRTESKQNGPSPS